MDAENDGPIFLPTESGVLRPVLLLWAERMPAACGFAAGFLMLVTAMYGDGGALYGLLLIGAWQAYWIQAAKRDPQYGAVMWRAWWESPLPEQLEAWPDLGAPGVKREASVPVRGEEGAHVYGGTGIRGGAGQAGATHDTSKPVTTGRSRAGAALVYSAISATDIGGDSDYREEMTRKFPAAFPLTSYRSVVADEAGADGKYDGDD